MHLHIDSAVNVTYYTNNRQIYQFILVSSLSFFLSLFLSISISILLFLTIPFSISIKCNHAFSNVAGHCSILRSSKYLICISHLHLLLRDSPFLLTKYIRIKEVDVSRMFYDLYARMSCRCSSKRSRKTRQNEIENPVGRRRYFQRLLLGQP